MAKKILIVDDDPINRQIIARNLEKKGYKTAEARDGLEGVKIAKDQKPNLILMDIEMPQMDGFKALEEIKKGQLTKDIPVILMSAGEESEDKALQLGYPFLRKPFGINDLISEIAKIQ